MSLDYFRVDLSASDKGKTIVLPHPIKRFKCRATSSYITVRGLGTIGSSAIAVSTPYTFQEGIKEFFIEVLGSDTTLEIVVEEHGNPEDDLKFVPYYRGNLIIKEN